MTEKKELAFALIGCGSIARKHVESIRRMDGCRISCVCDRDESVAKALAGKLGVPAYTDPHLMTAREAVDVFVVLAPSGAHAQVILELVKYGRHFVVEKPLTLRLTDADRIIHACDESACRIFVVQQNRFNPPIVKLKEALASGRFGKAVMATARVRWCRRQDYYSQSRWRGTWAYDGGVLSNQANHHVDMLTWLMGDVDSVMAMGATRLASIEAEDTAAAILRFHSGAIGIIEATTATRPGDLEGSISVLGEKGSVVVGGFFMNELLTWSFEEELPGDKEMFKLFGKTPEAFAWNHTEYYKDVVACLRSGRKGLVDGLEGRKSLELISAIYESIESGREVVVHFVPRKSRLGIAGAPNNG